ncbi:hypothetical protein Syun_009875 [Stephania yunnanensis]|uniref:Uncharacterized protein n=1 Tax=Stephania yunnanensis TaxID=152371 RepID=A0AAP0KFB1_9MAGN
MFGVLILVFVNFVLRLFSIIFFEETIDCDEDIEAPSSDWSVRKIAGGIEPKNQSPTLSN